VTAEEIRLEEAKARRAHWQRWGPYLSERAWGTVREDYSPGGAAWEYLPQVHARSKAYRWNDDGLGGICDRHQQICFAIALWNGSDPILKERLFGLTGNEGNHGEDVKECYFYLDSTPTHSYMKFLYKYPQVAFPYSQLVEENRRRGKLDAEFELLDTGVFAENRYFDVVVEYAKSDPDDILIRIQATNRGPDAARLDLMPTIWFRNTWSWGRAEDRPVLKKACCWPASVRADGNVQGIELHHKSLGRRWLACESTPRFLFTENEKNTRRLYGLSCGYAKDGIHDYVLYNDDRAVNPVEPNLCNQLKGFKRRLEWFIENRPDLTGNVASMSLPGEGERRLLSIVNPDRLRRVLSLMLDEREFLSPYGIRSLSRAHHDCPYTIAFDGREYQVHYEPAESTSSLFGGNSNWRGPVWFPVNFLLVESLQKFHHYLGDNYKLECPTGSGRMLTLWEIAAELSRRLTRVFLRDENGRRPVHGENAIYRDDPNWRDLVLFYECFHGDNGTGLGASHQTGWTALVAKLLQQSGERT